MFCTPKYALAFGLALAMFVLQGGAQASRFKVLYHFNGGSDGANPAADLIADAAGNLYGTTYDGGGATACANNAGCGTVFKLAPGDTETVLHAFQNGNDGAYPSGALIMDKAAKLYGTAYDGGGKADGSGIAFSLAANGKEKVLHSFVCTEGTGPLAGLIADSQGNFYGTTVVYGGNACGLGSGTVFKLAPSGKLTVLHRFAGGSDGDSPEAGLIADAAGNLYGTTYYGGGTCNTINIGCGTVFKLAPDGTESVLHAFTGGNDGAFPSAGLLADKAGNLYGTTQYGGGTACQIGCGTVFKIAPDGTGTVLYSFCSVANCADGELPSADLIADAAGNLYGTTQFGGTGTCRRGAGGCGTIFELAPDGTETVLHSFHGGHEGSVPVAGLIAGSAGILYGTAEYGGNSTNCPSFGRRHPAGCGIVFKLTK